ncbi:MAG: protein-glutamine glutaminase family protein [Oligoflexus sp.]
MDWVKAKRKFSELSLLCAFFLSACGSPERDKPEPQEEVPSYEAGPQKPEPSSAGITISDDGTADDSVEEAGDSQEDVAEIEDYSEDQRIERARQIVFQEIDYIPQNPRLGICNARALYKAMEFASQQIASESLVLLGDLQAVRGIEWGYHVAPVLISQQLGEALVFDFALATEPLTINEWIALTDRLEKDAAYDYILLSGSQYVNVYIRDDRERYIDYETLREQLQKLQHESAEARFEAMPSFQVSEIGMACREARAMWEFELDGRALQEKQKQLDERTHELLGQLQDLGLLQGDRRELNCRQKLD